MASAHRHFRFISQFSNSQSSVTKDEVMNFCNGFFRSTCSRTLRSSSSTDVRPSLNRANHSNALDLLRAESPKAVSIILYVSDALLPSLKQNLMQILCSKISDIIKFDIVTQLVFQKRLFISN